MTIYHLSNSQRKDLLVRGTPIWLALPAPQEDPRDAIAWARSVLPADLRALVHTAEPETIEVAPKPTGPRETLTDLLGVIVGNRSPAGQWTIWIECVVVCLLPPGEQARHKAGPVQWPVNVIIDRKPLLKEREGISTDGT